MDPNLIQPSASPIAAPQTTPAPQQAPTMSPPTGAGQQMSVDDFANSIKARYPQYQSLDNQDLTQKIIAKYPQYASQVNMNSGQQSQTQGPPGYFSRLGSSLVNGSVGQEIEGIGKGIGGTISGLSSMGQNALGGITDAASHLFGGPNISRTPTMNQTFGAALTPQGGWQQVGNAEEKLGELAAPTEGISALKDLAGGVDIAGAASKIPGIGGALETGINAVKNVPYLGTGLSYATQKVLQALPEAGFGTVYGATQGENNKQALQQGATFGTLSGIGDAAGDLYNSLKGSLGDSINTALGMTGKMGPDQAVARPGQALRAFQAMNNLADDITVKTPEGAEQAWNPTKDGFYEAMQALQQTKQKIFDGYTELMNQAGQDVKFTPDDFQKVEGALSTAAKDTTGAFQGKAASIVNDMQKNYGMFDEDGKFLGYKPTDLSNIQKFIQSINTDVNPLSDKAGAEMSSTASQQLRNVMDQKIENVTNPSEGAAGETGQYQGLRNTYSDLKSVENDMVNQFKKSARGVGGQVGKYIQGFGTVDSLVGLLSHNPTEIARGGAWAALGALKNYMKDPTVALQDVFSKIDNEPSSALRNRAFGSAPATNITTSPVMPK